MRGSPRPVRFLGLVLLALLLGGRALGQFAALRLAHLAEDAEVGVLLDGQPFGGTLQPPVVTDYMLVSAGDHRLELVAGGDGQTRRLAALSLTLAPGSFHTLVTVPAGDEDGGLAARDLVDTLDAVPQPGSALVRFVHAAGGRGSLGIVLAQGPATKGAGPGPLVVLAPLTASGYLPVPAGRFRLRATSGDGAQVLLSAPDLALEPGAVVTLFLFGNGDSLQARIVLDALLDADGPDER